MASRSQSRARLVLPKPAGAEISVNFPDSPRSGIQSGAGAVPRQAAVQKYTAWSSGACQTLAQLRLTECPSLPTRKTILEQGRGANVRGPDHPLGADRCGSSYLPSMQLRQPYWLLRGNRFASLLGAACSRAALGRFEVHPRKLLDQCNPGRDPIFSPDSGAQLIGPFPNSCTIYRPLHRCCQFLGG